MSLLEYPSASLCCSMKEMKNILTTLRHGQGNQGQLLAEIQILCIAPLLAGKSHSHQSFSSFRYCSVFGWRRRGVNLAKPMLQAYKSQADDEGKERSKSTKWENNSRNGRMREELKNRGILTVRLWAQEEKVGQFVKHKGWKRERRAS